MKTKQIIMQISIMVILLMSFVSAVEIIAGEPKIIQLPESYVYYTITDNSTEIDLTVINNGLNVTIILSKYSQEGNFTITFYNSREEIISSDSYRGGRGSCETKWVCTDWSVCTDGIQTRICSYPANWCTPRDAKPSESQICTVSGTTPEIPVTPTGFFAGITGAVIGTLGRGGTVALVIVIIAIVGGVIFFSVRKKK